MHSSLVCRSTSMRYFWQYSLFILRVVISNLLYSRIAAYRASQREVCEPTVTRRSGSVSARSARRAAGGARALGAAGFHCSCDGASAVDSAQTRSNKQINQCMHSCVRVRLKVQYLSTRQVRLRVWALNRIISSSGSRGLRAFRWIGSRRHTDADLRRGPQHLPVLVDQALVLVELPPNKHFLVNNRDEQSTFCTSRHTLELLTLLYSTRTSILRVKYPVFRVRRDGRTASALST